MRIRVHVGSAWDGPSGPCVRKASHRNQMKQVSVTGRCERGQVQRIDVHVSTGAVHWPCNRRKGWKCAADGSSECLQTTRLWHCEGESRKRNCVSKMNRMLEVVCSVALSTRPYATSHYNELPNRCRTNSLARVRHLMQTDCWRQSASYQHHVSFRCRVRSPYI